MVKLIVALPYVLRYYLHLYDVVIYNVCYEWF